MADDNRKLDAEIKEGNPVRDAILSLWVFLNIALFYFINIHPRAGEFYSVNSSVEHYANMFYNFVLLFIFREYAY